MKHVAMRFLLASMASLIACGFPVITSAQTRTIRIVAYNIEDDINGATTPLPGLITPSSGGSVTNGGALEGIGEEILGADPAQPIDILALEETTSNPITVQPIVDGLNIFYSTRGIPAGYAILLGAEFATKLQLHSQHFEEISTDDIAHAQLRLRSRVGSKTGREEVVCKQILERPVVLLEVNEVRVRDATAEIRQG